MTRLEEIDNANRGQDVYKLTRIWLDERGLEQQSVSGLLTCTMRHIDTLEDKNAAQRQAIEDLRKQLSESVPRSRYDACNQDWLDAKAKLEQVQQAASKVIEQLEGRVQALEGAKDNAYLERNRVVALLARLFPSGIAKTAIKGWSEDWHGCVYIDLPTGQVSWHYHDSHAYLFSGLPPYQKSWDGHSTETKYQRVQAALAATGEEGQLCEG